MLVHFQKPIDYFVVKSDIQIDFSICVIQNGILQLLQTNSDKKETIVKIEKLFVLQLSHLGSPFISIPVKNVEIPNRETD